ncbi:MAG: hypothetical protein K8W52_25800 [Deltaproteobacteria bacterium]|nr:hypothetical protein [Deltaproteobacteria bacterium]
MWAVAACILAAATPAVAGPEAAIARQKSLDGVYLHLGPALGVGDSDAGVDTFAGGAVSLTRLREGDLLGVIGGRISAARWTEREAGRIDADLVVGTRRLGFLAGVAAGPILDISGDHHPRIGGSARIWCYAGVVPYVRVGVLAASGRFIEAGLELPLPVWRWRR